jgi:hypothetical protein
MNSKLIPILFAIATCPDLLAQQIILPDSPGWNVVEEGKQLNFRVRVLDSLQAKHFSISGAEPAILMDTLGNLSWQPGYQAVSRLEKEKEISFFAEALLLNGTRIRQPITLRVLHVNRPPTVEDLPVFYVKQATGNSYQISSDFVYDSDEDPIIFKPFQNQLPEGVQMSSAGLITWAPSRNQFNSLKNTPLYIDFIVQDQPEKAEVKGRIRVAQTQLDLPPELVLVPGDSSYTIKEDELLNIKLYASDPNGDDNISAGGFVASDNRVDKKSFKENTLQQSEFTWLPGYSFVEEVEKFKTFQLTFYVIDKSNNKAQRKVSVKILDAENLDEKDKLLYIKYKNSLVAAKNLIDQLDDNHDALTKMYKQAKKGKKQRAILNASLGATTGISPLVLPTDQSKIVSSVGGTTVLTLGTLEATEVIGKSKSDILEKMKVNVEIRNQLQVEGDNFARKFALKSARRQKEFDTDREKLLPIINNQKLVLLELDAIQKNKSVENKELKKTFPDFSEE